MASDKNSHPRTQLAARSARLIAWLNHSAYPLWAANGIDPANGGFIETLAQNGMGLPHPRRARVHPRQIYSFAQAPVLGWKYHVEPILRRGLAYFTAHYRRSDGLFRTLAGVDGTPLDDRALLYDQAFALLGYAAAAAALDAVDEFEARALELREAIAARLRVDHHGFRSGDGAHELREANPHMHLLEACLAWVEIGSDAGWADWARSLVHLALEKFIDSRTGALRESFTTEWRPAPGLPGRVIEPGHQFEWAWLLLRAESLKPGAVRDAALRLIAIGEHSGVHNQVAVNALLDDFSVHDANARFWPQTERLKAALLAAQLTGAEAYWAMALAAADSLFPYLDTPVAGLWLDVRLPGGQLIDAPAPASTFYHLVGAISALEKTLAAA